MTIRMKWDDDLNDSLSDAFMFGLKTAAEVILHDAQKKVPVETGILRASGTVTEGDLPNPEEVYKAAQKEISSKYNYPLADKKSVYISFNTPYAIYQHEAVGLQHKEGEAKYLEKALDEGRDKIPHEFRRAFRRYFR